MTLAVIVILRALRSRLVPAKVTNRKWCVPLYGENVRKTWIITVLYKITKITEHTKTIYYEYEHHVKNHKPF